MMNFDIFLKKRHEYVEWMTANGYNEGDCEKNGEFKVLQTFRVHYDLFIDIGANNGIFIDKINAASLVEGSKQTFVIAFEPNPNLTGILEKKIILGNLIKCALSNHKGKAIFNIYSEDDTASSLFDRSDMMPHFTSKVEKIEVNLDLLDSYLPLIKCSSTKGIFIKIDAEGAELPILEGSLKVFAKLPVIFMMFEYSKAWNIGGNPLKKAFHLLDNQGFKIYRVTPLGLEAMRFYVPDMDGTDYCNYFAVKGLNIGDVLESESIPSRTHNKCEFYLFP